MQELDELRKETLQFLFLLDQKLKSYPDIKYAIDLFCQVTQTFMQGVDRFAPKNILPVKIKMVG